jgi:hypothetical protein
MRSADGFDTSGSASDWHDTLSAVLGASRIQRTDFRVAVLDFLLMNYIYRRIRLGRVGKLPDDFDSDLFLRAHRAALDADFTNTLLSVAILERIQRSVDDEQWATYVELLNLVSMRSEHIVHAAPSDLRLATNLRVDFAKDPYKIGLLKIIAINAAVSAGNYAPLDVETLARIVPNQSDPDVQACLLIFRARQGLFSKEHVQQAVELLGGPARTFFSMLARALSYGAGQERAESLLVAGYDHLRTTEDADTRQELLMELSDIFGERTTGLAEKSNWERLGLPGDLLEIRQ